MTGGMANIVSMLIAPRPPDVSEYVAEHRALLEEFEATGIGWASFAGRGVPLTHRMSMDAMHQWWARRGYEVRAFTAWLDDNYMWHVFPIVTKVEGRVAWSHAPRWRT